MHKGRLEVLAGCMFAGKTRALLARVRALRDEGHGVWLLKPVLDTRYSTTDVVSHDGEHLPADIVRLNGTPWPYDARIVAIDEAQFLTPEAVPIVLDALRKGTLVILAGLDLTSKGTPFGAMPTFLSLADSVTKLTARCAVCGERQANRTYRTIESDQIVMVGGAEAYEPRCLACMDGASHV